MLVAVEATAIRPRRPLVQPDQVDLVPVAASALLAEPAATLTAAVAAVVVAAQLVVSAVRHHISAVNVLVGVVVLAAMRSPSASPS